MSSFFHILQWIVSLIGVAALCYLNYLIVKALISMLKEERGARIALVVFLACMLLATGFQRIRIGFWDWPDVEYEAEAVNKEATARFAHEEDERISAHVPTRSRPVLVPVAQLDRAALS